MRRILISQTKQVEDKLVGDVAGLAGEEFQAEIYQPYGVSANPKDGGESVLLEINGDPDNYVALPTGGGRVAEPGETVIYHGDSVITLTDEAVEIVTGGHSFKLADGKISTDMDITTSGNIKAKNVNVSSTLTVSGSNYKTHTHGGVKNGGGITSGVLL